MSSCKSKLTTLGFTRFQKKITDLKKITVIIALFLWTVEMYCFAGSLCLCQQLRSIICHWYQNDTNILKKMKFRPLIRSFITLLICILLHISWEERCTQENDTIFSVFYFSTFFNSLSDMYFLSVMVGRRIVSILGESAWHSLHTA